MSFGFSTFTNEASISNTGLFKTINFVSNFIAFKNSKFAGVPQGPLSMMILDLKS